MANCNKVCKKEECGKCANKVCKKEECGKWQQSLQKRRMWQVATKFAKKKKVGCCNKVCKKEGGKWQQVCKKKVANCNKVGKKKKVANVPTKFAERWRWQQSWQKRRRWDVPTKFVIKKVGCCNKVCKKEEGGNEVGKKKKVASVQKKFAKKKNVPIGNKVWKKEEGGMLQQSLKKRRWQVATKFAKRRWQ